MATKREPPLPLFQPGATQLTCPVCHDKPLAINGRGKSFERIELFCGCGQTFLYQLVRKDRFDGIEM